MPVFSDDFKETVRRATNIVDVVSQYTQLKKVAGHHKGLCPLPGHNEKTPSFTINEDLQFYYCFGCHRGGDIFKFAQEVMAKDFPAAVEYFAERAGIELPKEQVDPKTLVERDEKKALFRINQFAAKLFQKNLEDPTAGLRAQDYFKKRGLSPEIIERFQLGYAIESWDQLANSLQHKGASLDKASELGLTKKRKTGDGFYDIFRDRVMFPILSLQGDILGFGGRVIDQGEPKYLNSPESAIFHKRLTFYGINEAAPFIRNEQAVILVEGYMDVLALHQNGVKNSVAALGTAFTKDHAKHLARYARKVFVLFDGDSAGESASKRALPLLLAEGLLPQAIELPSGKDPDDLIREIGQAGFEQKLKESKDLYSVILNAAIGGRVLTHSEKVTVLDEMKVYFVEGIDPTLARLYASETAQKLGLDGRTVSDAFLKSLKLAPIQANVAPVRPNRPKTQGKKDADKIEVTLAALAFLENTFLQKLTEMGIEEHFLSEDLTLILKKAQELSGQNLGSSDSLLALMSAEIQSIGLLEHLMAIKAGKYGSDLNRLFEDCARRLRERILKGKSLAIINEMGVGTDPEKLERLRSIQEDRLKLMKSAERVGEEKE